MFKRIVWRICSWLPDESPYQYLMFIDNWHKVGWISRIMCYLGRHDYEATGIESCDRGTWACLECFYCEHKKKSLIKD